MNFAVKTYFCPRCGKGYESSECQKLSSFSLANVRCPKCGVAVELSGGALIVLGLVIWFISSLVLDTVTPVLGAWIGGAMIGFGLLRLIRQFRAIWRARQR
jgi:ribosomal protein S27AE